MQQEGRMEMPSGVAKAVDPEEANNLGDMNSSLLVLVMLQQEEI